MARKVLAPSRTWYHTREPPKSTWKSVQAPSGLESTYSSACSDLRELGAGQLVVGLEKDLGSSNVQRSALSCSLNLPLSSVWS